MTKEGISYTEKEFDYAVERGLKIIALIHNSPDELSFKRSEQEPGLRQKLEAFKGKVMDGRLVKSWSATEELPGLVALSLTKTIKTYPAVGWIRADLLASDKANRKILDLQEEIDLLKRKLESMSLEAPEGAEKLAQGGDIYGLKLKVNYSNAWLNYHDPDKGYFVEFNLDVTWDELFGMVGVPALNPIRETKLKSQICTSIKDSYFDQLMKDCEEGYRITSISMSETQFQTIRYQFGALGYLNTIQEVKLNKEVEKEVNFCELTPFGKKKLMKVRAIYKDENAKNLVQSGTLTRSSRVDELMED